MCHFDNFDIDQIASKLAQRWNSVHSFYRKKISVLDSFDNAENAKRHLFFGHPIQLLVVVTVVVVVTLLVITFNLLVVIIVVFVVVAIVVVVVTTVVVVSIIVVNCSCFRWDPYCRC